VDEIVPASSAIDARPGALSGWRDLPRLQRLRLGGYLGYLAVLTLLFARPLTRHLSIALQNALNSYTPLVPVISGYLVLTARRPLLRAYRSSVAGTAVLAAIGGAAVAAATAWQPGISVNDYLSLTVLAYVAFIGAGGFLFLGSKWMAAAAFPMFFLIFMVPLPDRAVEWIEAASVLASAEAAAFLFNVSGTPIVRDGTIMALPSITLRVAQECSGIRSTVVLFITSLLAAHLFLARFWRRALLVAFVIPLGIVRNGFRILVIGLLCEYVGPHMIHSPIHRRGGPVFFLLSLGPLFLLMWWLRRGDRRTDVSA
jgi:exosortase C (VPDSG-CTERM-specific)